MTRAPAINNRATASDRGTGAESRAGGEPRTGGGSRTGAEPRTSSDARTWTIAQVADEFDVTHRTVRHYEELGLITPERRGTARLYRRRDRTRLNLILRGKRLGFPLEEIRTIIDLYDEPRGQASQLIYVLDQIHERRSDLERRRSDLEDALKELDDFESRCQADLRAVTDS